MSKAGRRGQRINKDRAVLFNCFDLLLLLYLVLVLLKSLCSSPLYISTSDFPGCDGLVNI